MTPAEAQQYCTAATQKSGSNFYYSFLFLPRHRREAMYTVYAFCHEVDDAVDHPPSGSHPDEQLARWRQEITAIYQGTPTYPVTISLADHVRNLGIPQEYLEELINGVEMDLTTKRYATFDDLYPYCYRVASVVGLICLKVFGTQATAAQDYAINLGIAFQLTNILRDVAVDADRDRVYLPQEDFARFNYREEDLLAKSYSSQFQELMKFECARAHTFYQKAYETIQALPCKDRRSLVAAEIMRGVYSRILHRIEAMHYQVFGPRIRLSSSYRFAIAAGIWLRSCLLDRVAHPLRDE